MSQDGQRKKFFEIDLRHGESGAHDILDDAPHPLRIGIREDPLQQRPQ